MYGSTRAFFLTMLEKTVLEHGKNVAQKRITRRLRQIRTLPGDCASSNSSQLLLVSTMQWGLSQPFLSGESQTASMIAVAESPIPRSSSAATSHPGVIASDSVSPLFAPLIDSRVRKAFACQSYVFGAPQVLCLPLLHKIWGWGAASHTPLATGHFRLSPVGPAVTGYRARNSFRPSSYVSMRPQVLYAQQLHKTGGWEGYHESY
jgi:hypothetical protein